MIELDHGAHTRESLLPLLITAKGYQRGVEVGVREGLFSECLLAHTQSLYLIGIDIHLLDSAMRLERLYPGRFQMSCEKSPECASMHADGHFDFIHIDADHSYAAVKKDLEAWWPKLAPGGCMSGDDYAFVHNPAECTYGVVEAVNEFADSRGLPLFLTGVEGHDRNAQLAWARLNGEQATRYLSRQSHAPFVNPCWFFFKPE